MEMYTPLYGVRRTFLRLPGFGGAALFLSPIIAPGNRETQDVLVRNYDIGLLSPDRKVEYLARRANFNFISNLAKFFWAVAKEIHPEKSVPDFQDIELGLSISVVSSTDFLVELQISVVKELETTPLEFDMLNFETSRVTLIGMMRALKIFDGESSDDLDDEELPW